MIFAKNILQKNKLGHALLFVSFILGLILTLFFFINSTPKQRVKELKAKAAAGVDLDVTYTERIPRYYRYCVEYSNGLPQLCSGTETQKRWPDLGESITYTSHLINKGDTQSPNFDYQWLVDGVVVATGSAAILSPGQETTVTYQTTFPSTPQSIQFKVDPQNLISEAVVTNNALTIGSHDLTLSIWVERGLYDIFNQTLNLSGSYSFEDWVEAQFAKMNERFTQAQYPVAPNGIKDRVRIEKIVVADNLDGSSSPMNSDQDLYLIDGRWQFSDGDLTNAAGQGGAWQNYVNVNINRIDWGLIHEMAHQLGIIDLYKMNLPNDPANNNGMQVTDLSSSIIDYKILFPVFWHPGLMSGGDTSPYNDGTYFESHTAGGMNSHYNFRRGYYGEYLYDTPMTNYLKILDLYGNPLSGAQVALYQKSVTTEYIDNTPEISGATDSQGLLQLTNRPVTGITTATGHTLRDNPFGQISAVGQNGTMFLKVTKDNQEYYNWLRITDLNLAYWMGNRDSATYTYKSDIEAGRVLDPRNQALNKPASSNKPITAGREPGKAVDGDKTAFGSAWSGGLLNPGDWWQVDLGNTLNLGKVTIYPYAQNYSDLCKKFHIEVSPTGSFSGEQTTVATETDWFPLKYRSYVFPPIMGRYVRFVCDITQNWVQLQEFEVYALVNPTPTPTPTPISGDGLSGSYYNNKTLGGTAVTRVDPVVNFNWGTSSPIPQIKADGFSVRWTGLVLPQYNETYTFYTRVDDGVRLWVNNQLLIDRWVNQKTAVESSGNIAVMAGQKYNIKMEYYENKANAVAELRWSSPSTPKQIIPQSQLFSK